MPDQLVGVLIVIIFVVLALGAWGILWDVAGKVFENVILRFILALLLINVFYIVVFVWLFMDKTPKK